MGIEPLFFLWLFGLLVALIAGYKLGRHFGGKGFLILLAFAVLVAVAARYIGGADPADIMKGLFIVAIGGMVASSLIGAFGGLLRRGAVEQIERQQRDAQHRDANLE